MTSNASRARSIAHFSMEIALEAGVPTYSGGLGILTGDTVRAAADRDLPLVAVTLLYRKGYFTSVLTPADGRRSNRRNGYRRIL